LIQPERVQALNARPARPGRFVLYWMQAAQRTEFNHALEFAAREANALGLPLVAYFGLTPRFPEANARHYAFLLEGLEEAAAALERRGIRLVVRPGPPDEGVVELGRRAALVVVDAGYLRVERAWRKAAAGLLECPLVQVETNAVVPVNAASPKEEYAAATLRPKIYRLLEKFLVPLKTTRLKKDSLGLRFDSLAVENPAAVLATLPVDRSVAPVTSFKGGASRGRRLLRAFIARKLPGYAEGRNDPNRDAQSGLSPYLHFGQLSPLQAALEVKAAGGYGTEAFLEELIVRRELSLNFVSYNPDYDRYAGLPAWCRATLAEHRQDRREYAYSPEDWEAARTHDPYWNAAQREMVLTGRMHGYMRMYWGKKILQWSRSPQEALRTALRLNNKYELDGRDPNAFAGVAWCFGKHDRPWGRRPVFGSIRYMAASGLRRKFDADAYVRRIAGLRS
jgi:deoxyribodipyrimidine photo-lyase